jgi:hypothetical protein
MIICQVPCMSRETGQQQGPTASRCVFDDILVPAGLRAEACRRRVSHWFDAGFQSKSISLQPITLRLLGGTNLHVHIHSFVTA